MRGAQATRVVLVGAVSALAFLAAFLGTRSGAVQAALLRRAHRGGTKEGGGYRPPNVRANGTQLVMIYFGSAHCAWANDPDGPALVQQVKSSLEAQARRRGWSFEAVGVALDWEPEEGLEHLRRFGRFDEVSAGYSWANMLALQYYGDLRTEPVSTPEILVVRRTLRRPDFVSGAANYSASGGQLLLRKAGLHELRSWARQGSPLESLPDQVDLPP